MNLGGHKHSKLSKAFASATGLGLIPYVPMTGNGEEKLDGNQGHPGTFRDRWNPRGHTGTHSSLSLQLASLGDREDLCKGPGPLAAEPPEHELVVLGRLSALEA